MARIVTVGAAQLGPIARSETRAQVVERMLALMREAARHGCDLVVFPELALTTFFPRWYFERQDGRRRVLRARDARAGDAAPVRRRARTAASASTSATRS